MVVVHLRVVVAYSCAGVACVACDAEEIPTFAAAATLYREGCMSTLHAAPRKPTDARVRGEEGAK